jgi:hypothetical protein
MEPERPPAFRITKEGVDHAFFRAVLRAGAQGFILGGTEPRSLAPAMPAAPIGIVDRQGGAASSDRRDNPTSLALAFGKRVALRLFETTEVMGLANAPQEPTAKAPAARAVRTVACNNATVAANNATTTSMRIAGV